MVFKLLKSMLTSRSKIHIDSGAFVSSLEVSGANDEKAVLAILVQVR